MIGFSEALRSELRRDGIAVSVLCPPDTATPGFERENLTKPPETHAVSAGASMLSADDVADALLAGMAKRSFLIIPGREARLGHLVKRFFPGVVERVMDRQVRARAAAESAETQSGIRGAGCLPRLAADRGCSPAPTR